MTRQDNFDGNVVEVFNIAEAYAKEHMNGAIEPAHVLKALLHKDIGLVPFIEKTLQQDYYYMLDWADMRIKMTKKSPSSKMLSLSDSSEAVVSEANSLRQARKGEEISVYDLLMAVVTPGVGFSFEQLKTFPLQKEAIVEALNETSSNSKNTKGGHTADRPTFNKSIATYCKLKNELQAEGRIDKIVGFEKELEGICEILSRKTKPNILITGESGVGKTSLVNAFVQAVFEDRVPSFLQDSQVYELDTIALSIGISYQSEVEARMKKILDELTSMENAILVIESFDKLMDKQSALNGTVNLLKASLNEGLLCICTSSVEGFTKNIETDKEITGKFEHIIIEEPSADETKTILETVVKSFEEYHQLKVSDEVIENAIRLAKRYFSEKHLPESAIDLIDRTMALLRIENDKVEDGKETTVGLNHLMKVVSQKTGIPLGNVQAAERDRLVNAEEILKKRVVGQDHAIKAVLDSIFESRSGLNKKGQPIGSFFFLGPTGTGKTELAKALAEFLFQDDTAILRFDMSEYKEEHSVALLYGHLQAMLVTKKAVC